MAEEGLDENKLHTLVFIEDELIDEADQNVLLFDVDKQVNDIACDCL